MPKARRNQIHDQRIPLLQPGSGHQRRGRRRYRAREREGDEHCLDEHEPQLGPELAIQRRFGRPGSVVQGHGQ